jgi:hypothetical protein
MTTTYLAAAAREQLDQAQAEIDRHVAAGLDGRCLACGEEQPCAALRLAHRTFRTYGRLPMRRAGLASRGVDTGGGFGWFTDAPPPVVAARLEEPTP